MVISCWSSFELNARPGTETGLLEAKQRLVVEGNPCVGGTNVAGTNWFLSWVEALGGIKEDIT